MSYLLQRRREAQLLLRRALLWGLVLGCFSVQLEADGTQTGTLAGRILDPDGEGLPGVAVHVTGSAARRSAVSDDLGRFRFPALEPGPYSVLADLLGLEQRLDEVAVFIDKTTSVEIVLGKQEAATTELAEAIEVIAEAPIVDSSALRIGGNLSRDFLDELPVERFYQSVALVLPGVSGGDDGNPNFGGALRSSNLYLVDGVDTTDPTTGLFGLNLQFDALQSVDVTTSAIPAEYGRASGAVINVVTRSGGSTWEGTIRWLGQSDRWRSDYESPGADSDHLESRLQAANTGIGGIDHTISMALGGPVVPDRLFFFGGFEDGASSFAAPTLQGDLWNAGAEQESRVFKLTYAAGSSSTWVAQHTADVSDFASFRPFDGQPGENLLGSSPLPLGDSFVDPIPGDLNALQARSQEGAFTRLRGEWVVHQNLSLRFGVANQDRSLERSIQQTTGVTSSSPHVGITDFIIDPDGTEILAFALFNGPTERGREERSRLQLEAGGDYFLRLRETEHEIRAGIDYQRTRSEIALAIPGRSGLDPATGRPSTGQIFVDLDPRADCLVNGICRPFDPETGEFFPFLLLNFWDRSPEQTEVETTSVYVADTLSWGRWLLSAGLRFETMSATSEIAGTIASDSSLSPRLGLSWQSPSPGALLSASWSRYSEPFPHQMLDAFSRKQVFSGFTEYAWDWDREECYEADPADPVSDCWAPSGKEDFFPLQPTTPSPTLSRSSVDEWTLGFERQITATTGLSLFLVQRRWNDLWDNRPQAVFDPEGGFLGIDGEVENLPEASRQYQGLELLVQRRLSNRWQLMASYTWSEAKGNLFTNDGLDTFADFSEITDVNLVQRYGAAPYDRTHRIRAYGSYRMAVGRTDLLLGSALRYESGVPWQREALDELGRLYLTPRGSERLDDLFQWDISAIARIPMGELETEVKIEVFNLSDEQQVLGVETLVDTGIAGQARGINDLQAPRTYRLSLAFRF